MQNKTKPKSNQDYFNRLWRHFVVEFKTRCTRPASQLCVYSNLTGTNGCAVGCVLPRPLARLADNHKGSLNIRAIIRIAEVEEWLKNVTVPLLSAAQQWHDKELQHNHYLAKIGKVERINQLRKIAKKHGLATP